MKTLLCFTLKCQCENPHKVDVTQYYRQQNSILENFGYSTRRGHNNTLCVSVDPHNLNIQRLENIQTPSQLFFIMLHYSLALYCGGSGAYPGCSLNMSWEYTPNETPVHHRATFTHVLTSMSTSMFCWNVEENLRT